MRLARKPLVLAGLVAAAAAIGPAVGHEGHVVAVQNQTFKAGDIPAGSYTLDKTHANIVFKISHLGFSAYIGRFNSFDATLDFNPGDPSGSKLDVKIDPKSIDTNHDGLEEHLQKADFFNVEKFPEITFKSTAIEQKDERTGTVTGELTLLGVTKPVTLDVTFNGGAFNEFAQAFTLGFSAETTLNRTDFGMTSYAPAVGETVALIIEAEFQKKGD